MISSAGIHDTMELPPSMEDHHGVAAADFHEMETAFWYLDVLFKVSADLHLPTFLIGFCPGNLPGKIGWNTFNLALIYFRKLKGRRGEALGVPP